MKCFGHCFQHFGASTFHFSYFFYEHLKILLFSVSTLHYYNLFKFKYFVLSTYTYLIFSFCQIMLSIMQMNL